MTQKLGLIHLYHGDGREKPLRPLALHCAQQGGGYPVQIIAVPKGGQRRDQSIGTARDPGAGLSTASLFFLSYG